MEVTFCAFYNHYELLGEVRDGLYDETVDVDEATLQRWREVFAAYNAVQAEIDHLVKRRDRQRAQSRATVEAQKGYPAVDPNRVLPLTPRAISRAPHLRA